jgi:IPT/TIG domain
VKKGGESRSRVFSVGSRAREYVDAESEDDAMSLKKRHIGRRVAGVGLGVALVVLGLQAPAFAAAPTVATVAPTTGPPGCVLVVTGTNFNNPNVTSVKFGTTTATFTIQSATELWTTVPAALAAGATTITIDNGSPPAAVAAFTVTNPATSGGGCVPTITSFTPICGSNSLGTVVTIAGTNLLKKDDGTNGDVRFAPYPALPGGAATPSNIATQTPTSIVVLVPSGATDGPIRVSTFNDVIGIGAALAATPFQVPPPDCAPVTGTEHARSITFKLKKSGKASGVVSSTEEEPFTACASEVPVKFKFKPKGKSWKNAGSTTTDDQGSYAKKLKGKPGKYKAIAAKVSIGDPVTDVCLKAVSAVRTIK